MSDLPPVLDPPYPPAAEPEPGPQPSPPPVDDKPKWAKKLGPLGTALVFLLAKLKAALTFIIPALKFLKLGKVLLTSGSMLVSIWVYSLLFGWKFAVGFVICIFIHEMGHVLAAVAYGIPVSAPIFIPGMGALIIQKRSAKSAWIEAVIGIGGPIAGTISGLACWGIYMLNNNPLFLGLAYTAFFLNLFNMTPMYPLDGGWIVGAISPYLWGAGLIILVGMLFMGKLTNPMIIILLIMSVPRIWNALKRGTADPVGGTPTTTMQKWTMGAAYLALCGFLLWGMSATHEIGDQRLRFNHRTQVAAVTPVERGG
jgi:Zn-dependent protease